MNSRCAAIAIAVLYIATNFATPASAQKLKSFDPTLGACEKAVGQPEDDSIIAARGWIVRCGDLDKDIENSEFATLHASEAKASKTESAAYAALITAFEKYRVLELELFEKGCGGGNSCSSELIQEEARINYGFLIMAEGFRNAGFPAFSENEFADADAALNRAYKESMSKYPSTCAPQGSENYDQFCTSRLDLRAMERAWIGYRDAWVTFGGIKWPQIPADTWRAYLTRDRVKHGGDGTAD